MPDNKANAVPAVPENRSALPLLSALAIPGEDELLHARPGEAVALSDMNGTLSAVLACRLAARGKRVLLVMDNDLKASRAADDIGRGAFLPGGEIDLTRAVGSLESS